MNDQIVCALKVFLPGYNPFPLKKARHWAQNYYRAAGKAVKSLGRAIPDARTFRRKLGQPVIRLAREYFSPDFISRSGLNKENILTRIVERFHNRKTAQNYFENIKQAYQTKDGIPARKIKEALPFGAADYCLKMTFGTWRLLGPIQGKGKGALALAEAYLTNQPKANLLTRSQDEITINHPTCLSTPARTNEFRMKLHNRLMHSAGNIIKQQYADRTTRDENEALNRLANRFILKKFVPFAPDGASHIGFVIHRDSLIPDDAPEILDIKYRIYKFFLGHKTADNLYRRWLDDRQATELSKVFYADMHLDIQVAVR